MAHGLGDAVDQSQEKYLKDFLCFGQLNDQKMDARNQEIDFNQSRAVS